MDVVDGHVRNSGSNSPASGSAFEHQLADNKESSSPQNLDDYADIGLVQDNSPSYTLSESQHQQDPPELPSFSVSPILPFNILEQFELEKRVFY